MEGKEERFEREEWMKRKGGNGRRPEKEITGKKKKEGGKVREDERACRI